MKLFAARSAFFAIVHLHVTVASASPYVGTDLTFEVDGHRWGFWSLLDSPSHDSTSNASQLTDWMADTSEGEALGACDYWVIGIGPIGAIYLTRGVAILCAILLVLLFL